MYVAYVCKYVHEVSSFASTLTIDDNDVDGEWVPSFEQ